MYVFWRAALAIAFWLVLAIPITGWLLQVDVAENPSVAVIGWSVWLAVSGFWFIVTFWYVRDHRED